MKNVFVVIRSHGPAWNRAQPLDAQANWRGHAEFMNTLEAEGAVILAGPLEGTDDAMLVMRAADEAEIRTRLSADPWGEDMLRTSQIAPWTLRIGQLLLTPDDR
ncbi:MAG TPA: YciI family protein [Rhizomicrobium sp.]|jgi:uncharacterized protein YciI|nr:YciI family protein [Rhizomicrobium sp.]